MKSTSLTSILSRMFFLMLVLLLFIGQASANAVYYPAKGDGVSTFTTYTGVTCTNLGASSPCARYNESSLRVDMDLDTVKYQILNNQGTWRYIQYDIPNPTGLIPNPVSNPKSLVWMNMFANNTNLRYVMQSHGIKLDIWGNGTPPSNYFNFTYTFSSGITYRMQGEEILFMDTVTGEPLWLIKYPTMQVNGTDVPLTFKKDGNKISIHAPDLFTNPEYNFSAGWELDPSTQSGSTIYISDRQNLTQVNADINNASALQNLGGGEWLLNANLINNNTANTFYMNDSDVTWLKINSTNTSGTPTYWYYLTSGKTEINNTKITSWNTTLGAVEDLPVSTWARSAVYASGTSSKMNISNSNLSYLGYNAWNKYGVMYDSSSGNIIYNSSFLQNYYGIFLFASSNNNLTSNTGTSNTSAGIYLYSSLNNNLISNTATSNTSIGIQLSSSSNNNLTSNTGTSNTSVGIYVESSSNNNLTSNTGTSNTSQGILLASSSNNNLTSNTGTSNTSQGIYVYSSSNNNLTSNTFNTNSTTTTVGDILTSTSSRNNTFINTSFAKPRKITFYEALLSEFNQSQDFISFVNTNVSIASTTNRSIANWNQNNITFTETFTGATQANYSGSGLTANSNYQIWNDTNIDFNLETNSNGVLPDFKINFTTSIRTVKIVKVINITDSYNISVSRSSTGTSFWANGTYAGYNVTDPQFNEQVNLTIWAWNSSGSGTLSIAPLYLNTTMPSGQQTVNPFVAVGVAAMGIAVSIAIYNMYRRRGRPMMVFFGIM